jgi:hypothetical protein
MGIDDPWMFEELSSRDSKIRVFLEALHQEVFHGLPKVRRRKKPRAREELISTYR